MKIESSKPSQAEKGIAASDKSETNFRSLFNTPEKLDSSANGGFAKVLEETGNQNVKDKDALPKQKTDRAENTKTAEAKKDEEAGRSVLNREKTEENNKRDGDRQRSEEQDENSAFALSNLQIAVRFAAQTTVPAARSILHVADLERIVSSIRKQNLENAEQVVISLKHSILEGLQIRLTLDGNGTLKAEFLALNEQIRNQLNARKQEISQILRERGVKLFDLNVRQGSEFAAPSKHSKENFPSGKISDSETADSTADITDSSNQTSYQV